MQLQEVWCVTVGYPDFQVQSFKLRRTHIERGSEWNVESNKRKSAIKATIMQSITKVPNLRRRRRI